MLFSILLMLFMILAGTWAGLALFAPADASWPPARQTASLALNLAMLLLCWSGVAMAFGAACRRGVARADHGPDRLRRVAPGLGSKAVAAARAGSGGCRPFGYFTPFELVMGDPLPVENLLVLGAIAMTGFTVAYFIISQRDISR